MKIRYRFPMLLVAGALLVAPVAVRPGADSPANAHARDLGPGELVGEVVNTSNKVLKRRVQVRAGGREWTLHVPTATPVVHARQEVSVHDLDVGTYVRAIGTRIGSTRLRADQVYVIGDRLALRKTAYARRGGEAGFYASTAGYRTRYRR
jgi:hypothetical protein